MTSDNKGDNSPQDPEVPIFDRMELQRKIAEAVNNLTRVRILLLLWAFEELSINDLCKKLGKTRPTVTRHLQELKSVRLLNVRRDPKKGSKRKKLYSVRPNILSLTRLNLENLKTRSSEEAKEILSRDLKSDAETIEILRKILEDMIPYYEDLEQNLRETREFTPEKINSFYKRKHMNYYVEILDEEEFELYYKWYNENLEKLEEHRREKRLKKGIKIRNPKPFAVLHMILPIKEIQNARHKRLWKS